MLPHITVKCNFWSKLIFSGIFFLQFLVITTLDPYWIQIRINLKCWILIRIQWIRIHSCKDASDLCLAFSSQTFLSEKLWERADTSALYCATLTKPVLSEKLWERADASALYCATLTKPVLSEKLWESADALLVPCTAPSLTKPVLSGKLWERADASALYYAFSSQTCSVWKALRTCRC